MVEIILVKRRAREGELGLFMDNQVFEEEWSSLPQGVDVKAECTVPANLKYLKFFWALVGKIVENAPEDRWLDKEDCSNELRLEARHYKVINDPLRNKAEIKPRSVAGLSADAWIRLLRRCTHVVITKYLQGMEEGVLKAEIEKMLGMDVFAEQPKPKGKSDVQNRKSAPQDARGRDGVAPQAQEQGDERLPVQGVQGLAPGQKQSGEQDAGEDRPTTKPPREDGPQTEDEYVVACRKWIAKQTDHNAALDYYDSTEQIATRAALKVKVGTNKMLRRELAEQFGKGAKP